MVGLLDGPVVQSWAETRLLYTQHEHLRTFVEARRPMPIGVECISRLGSKHDIADLVGCEMLLVGQWEQRDPVHGLDRSVLFAEKWSRRKKV